MENNIEKRNESIEMMKTTIAVCAALVIFLASAGFIVYKSVVAYRHNERWKDYDECGI